MITATLMMRSGVIKSSYVQSGFDIPPGKGEGRPENLPMKSDQARSGQIKARIKDRKGGE